jgi:ABC-2 type transport system ATP-binding protein
MIELSNVTKRYVRKGAGPDAVSGLTLSVPAGTVWAVVGPNGAGKSTLLSLILGFVRPSEGEVRLGGDRPRDYLRDHGAAYLPERFSLPPSWRARDALRLLARLDRVDAARVEAAIALFGLTEHVDKRTRELSRGLLQRLGLAQALLAPRDLIVLDEPTEGLDPVWRIRLRDIIADLRRADRTIIIASHDLDEVERIADRAVVLDAGRVRKVLDLTAPRESVDYRIRLATASDAILPTFPDAMHADELTFTVRVSSPAELSQRLGALIASGAIIAAVEPLHEALEERVRAALRQTPEPGA